MYLNSQKDLSEIVEFYKNGKIKRIEKYDAFYNKQTRKAKTLNLVSYYHYNSDNLVTQITDSTFYINGSVGIDKDVYEYDKNKRIESVAYYKGKFRSPYSLTKYSYSPFETTTVRRNDSTVIYHKTKEYEHDFYVKRFYGYYLDPKLKRIKTNVNGESHTVAYSDHADLQRYEDDKSIKNVYDLNGRLIRAEINSVFMNDRKSEYTLLYTYYNNGLLKSIRGYVPRYFKYEFWE